MRPLLKNTGMNRFLSRIAPTGTRLHVMAGMLAAIAALSSMWAEIEFHHHETGLHKPIVCSLCAYEKAVGHGFTTSLTIGLPAPSLIDARIDEPVFRLPSIACRRFTPIRAPPSA